VKYLVAFIMILNFNGCVQHFDSSKFAKEIVSIPNYNKTSDVEVKEERGLVLKKEDLKPSSAFRH